MKQGPDDGVIGSGVADCSDSNASKGAD
jgi:hypothetical protein